ncbi:MAG: excinuclease ABC subunit UvrC [Ruminococcaceae bacterium]|nr:excinuclease ABC subunit UvrC [Oscillospiraceae bacterium]
MTHDELKEKALSLPYAPGVYIMRNKDDKVIYVGKAKKLKNRVTQYFQDTASHTPKTRIMVSKIDRFEVIVAASEFEALVLECSLIKRYMPKYNILLKDDKGYPFVRLDLKQDYPRMSMVPRISDDGATYYGPFGSRGVTQSIMEAITKTLKLPDCAREFPRDIGKGRPCLNYHMKQCAGWCQGLSTMVDYRSRIDQARQLLQGNYKSVAAQIREQMLAAADALNFELAASLRDRLNAVENLSQKQLVTTAGIADTDVVGYAQTETKACFAVLHFSGGNLLDKEYEVFPLPDDKHEAVSSLLKQFYLSRGLPPKRVLLPFALEDASLFSELMEQQSGRKPKLIVPQRGNNMQLVELAIKNAYEEARRLTDKDEKHSATVQLLGKMLSIEPPMRIESYDISNISGTDIVASMVVFEDGKPKKSEYKKFRIEGLSDQDDYASMCQVILRRFTHFVSGDKGFDAAPDLLLIDGGVNHANVALEALRSLDLHFPVFGMVKDDRHRTRALVTPDGLEISIDANQTVFSFVGTIQEETHRFAITYHRQLRSKRLRYSALDAIEGIGPKRKEDLLKHFKSLTAIAHATLPELERFLPKNTARAVYEHFHKSSEETDP